MEAKELLSGYNLKNLTIGCLGGHSALDVSAGATAQGFPTLVVARKGREKTYNQYFKSEDGVTPSSSRGCIDDVITVTAFQNVLQEGIQAELRKRNTIFLHSRYFWVYFDDFGKVENDFRIPIFGSRHLLKLEERDGSTRLTTGQPYNQYHLLDDAEIRRPKVFEKPEDIDRLVIVKASEVARGYERAFFLCCDKASWEKEGTRLEKEGVVDASWRKASIEEFIVGAPVNFNFFFSPLSGKLELLGTDTRRQTNLDGFLRLPYKEQEKALYHVPLKMVETGHIAVTVKESLLEKAFELGEKFVEACAGIPKDIDPAKKGIIGPFALQGAVTAEEGKEDIVIFDVSFRIPGSPGIAATPYSMYLHGRPVSMGERIAMELKEAVEKGKVEEVVT